MNGQTRRIGILVVLTISVVVPLTIWYLWTHVLDTPSNRMRVNAEVGQLVAHSKNNPKDERVALELLRRARGSYSFEAMKAVVGLGDIGDAALPVINELADLMESDDPLVRREAANSLLRLGNRSVLVMDKLAVQIAKDRSDDESWFAASAMGKIGKPATKYLPLLRNRLGTGPVQFDYALEDAIKELEEIESQTEEPQDSP